MRIYPDDWRVRLATAMGVVICMGAAMMLGPVVGIDGFWPGLLSIVFAIIIGNVLGLFVGRRLFQPSSGSAPEKEKQGSSPQARSES